MNRDRLEGNWLQLKGKIKERWGKLTDDDLNMLEGKTDILIGKLQEHYGLTKEQAENELRTFQKEAKIPHDQREHVEV